MLSTIFSIISFFSIIGFLFSLFFYNRISLIRRAFRYYRHIGVFYSLEVNIISETFFNIFEYRYIQDFKKFFQTNAGNDLVEDYERLHLTKKEINKNRKRIIGKNK